MRGETGPTDEYILLLFNALTDQIELKDVLYWDSGVGSGSGNDQQPLIWHVNCAAELDGFLQAVLLHVLWVRRLDAIPLGLGIWPAHGVLDNLLQTAEHHEAAGVLIKAVLLLGVWR